MWPRLLSRFPRFPRLPRLSRLRRGAPADAGLLVPSRKRFGLPKIDVRQVGHRFQQVVALHDVNIEVHAGEFVCLLGPSGCGKSTLLRLVADILAEHDIGVETAAAPAVHFSLKKGSLMETPVTSTLAEGIAVKKKGKIGKKAKPMPPLQPIGKGFIVDKNGIIWDQGKAVGIWGVDGPARSPSITARGQSRLA